MRNSILKRSLLFVALIAFVTTAPGQQTGSVVGTAAHNRDAIVFCAEVTHPNRASAGARHTTTIPEELFSFSGAVPGDYAVKVESKGSGGRSVDGSV